jgi:hypothetical protein
MIVGGASGKRTLTDVMDEDLAAKRKKIDGTPRAARISRFFASPSKPTSQCEDLHPEEVFHACAHNAVKENVPPLSDDDVDLDMDKAESENNFVMQEDGYISPSSRYDRDDSTSELSSPDKPVRAVEDDDFEVDAISSPPITRSHRKAGGSGAMLVLGTRRPGPSTDRQQQGQADEVVDLRDVFMDDSTSDIDVFEDEQGARGIGSLETVSPSPSPQTPVDEDGDLELELELTDIEAEASVARTDIVASGWWMKYAANGKKPLMVGVYPLF